MALAGDAEPRRRAALILERETNGRGAIGLDGVADAGGFERGFNLGKDGARIFGARIVAGGNHEVASLARGVAHLGALGAVAIAAAAEERDDAAAGLRRQLAGQGDQVAQRVVGVRVVHNDGEGLAAHRPAESGPARA